MTGGRKFIRIGFLVTEERMGIVFMSVIPVSREHSLLNEMLKRWVNRT